MRPFLVDAGIIRALLGLLIPFLQVWHSSLFLPPPFLPQRVSLVRRLPPESVHRAARVHEPALHVLVLRR